MTTMDFSATLAALRRLRVETGSLVCFGCGHEHNYSTHGCAILRNAVEHMEAALSNYDSLSALVHHLETELKSEILSAAELRARMANEPLTLEQLREMDEPVWVACKPIEGGNGYWCLCQHGHIITPAGSIYDVKEIPHWVFYRRPLEGEV
nr:MAG TPA: hypothetical protein [Caudoviricetes sp.]